MSSKHAAVGLTVVAFALCTGSASAYRPPAKYLLNKAMEKQLARETKSLRVQAETQVFDISGVARGTPAAETWMVLGPKTLRKDVETADGTRTEIRVDDKLLVRTAGAPDKNSRAQPDAFLTAIAATAPLDDDAAADRVLKDAKAYGVNTEVVSLARFDGRVAWLVGSKPWDKDKPQLWIDKESLLVLRTVRFDKKADGTVQKIDQRYLGWGAAVGGSWFPSTLETWVDDRLSQRTLVRNVERNMSFDASQFK